MKKTIFSVFAILSLVLGLSYAESTNTSKISFSKDNEKTHFGFHPDQSQEPFDKMMRVLTHPRCVNCHPAGSKPIKGDDASVTRALGVPRGPHGEGLKGLNCSTCHSDENNDFSGVPGAPEWALAPEFMAWEGKTRVEIATQMMDPARNGGRSAQETLKHLTEHKLVLWAWDPGVDSEGIPREKPPVPKDEYIAAVTEWINNGAIIPDE